jgi:anti-anti-sigma regulatory factor
MRTKSQPMGQNPDVPQRFLTRRPAEHGFWHARCGIISARHIGILRHHPEKGDESMSTATAVQAHIAYELIEDTKHQVVVIEFSIHDLTSPVLARELGEQLSSLIRPQALQYFVLDFAGVRALGSTAFSEIVSFVHKARPVWVCNLDGSLRLGAALTGLDNWARFAANRRAAITEAERTARWDEEDTVDYPAWTR